MNTLPTSSWKPGDAVMLAYLTGTLALTDTGALVARTSPNSSAGVLLVWPYGYYTARDSRGVIHIYDATGTDLLSVGDDFSVAGGFLSQEDPGVGADQTPTFYVNSTPQKVNKSAQ